MLEDFNHIEYNPDTEITDYHGTYPVKDMKRVRCHLIENFKRESSSKLEFTIKRKCGIITRDLIDYMLHEIRPEHFVENAVPKTNYSDSNPFIHKILNIDEDDLIPSEDLDPIQDTNIVQIEKSNLPSSSSDGNFPQSSQNSQLNYYESVFTNSQKDDIQLLNRELGIIHGCEKTCHRNFPSKDELDEKELENLIYVCDFCKKYCDSKEEIEVHLKEEDHASASEYILEPKLSDTVDEKETTGTNYDEYFESTFNAKRKIKFIKNRACLKNFAPTKELKKCLVFCPKCHSCFYQSVLGASLHYKLCHSSSTQDEVYSIGEFDRTEKFWIEKAHACFTCNVKFKKLVDLVHHYSNTHHFPSNKVNEINIYKCPFDKCEFQTTKFFTFKTHIVGHPYFNGQNNNMKSVEVSVVIYKAPRMYFHQTKNVEKTKSDRENELEAVNELIKLNLPEDQIHQAKLRDKKVFLQKNLTDHSV
ncbi:unnamed protein product [Brachionus calyciflorus]|uniref:C2H2-type domain-containing protein n=1 Tax=Brachionus calyciflorus TaxID=104777 RepID=A0A813MAE1_9BILA|nr:unnamed protein product [Brachionus calyciflorus]